MEWCRSTLCDTPITGDCDGLIAMVSAVWVGEITSIKTAGFGILYVGTILSVKFGVCRHLEIEDGTMVEEREKGDCWCLCRSTSLVANQTSMFCRSTIED